MGNAVSNDTAPTPKHQNFSPREDRNVAQGPRRPLSTLSGPWSQLYSEDTYTRATLRVTSDARLMSAVRRMSYPISRRTWRNFILGSSKFKVPMTLSDRFFNLFHCMHPGQQNRHEHGLSRDELIWSLAVLKEPDEHLRLKILVIIFDINRANAVEKDVVIKFITVIYGKAQCHHLTALTLLFNQKSELSYSEFTSHFVKSRDGYLMEWYDRITTELAVGPEAELEALATKYKQDRIRIVIESCTDFSIEEIIVLEKKFQALEEVEDKAIDLERIVKRPQNQNSTTRRVIRHLSQEALVKWLCPKWVSSKLVRALLKTTRCSNSVDFQEFCIILSMCIRGSENSKLHFLFMLFANDETKLLETTDAIVNAIHSRHRSNNIMVSSLPVKTDLDFEGFCEWVTPSVCTILGDILLAASIDLGMCPASAEEENKVISWIYSTTQEEEEEWNLVSCSWWNAWCDFSSFEKAASAIPVFGCSNNIVLYRPKSNSRNRPGSIANWSLLCQSGSRRLLRELSVGKDYVVVPHAVWKCLQQWYTGGPELSRFTITSGDGKKFVEVDTLVLRVARTTANAAKVVSVTGQEVSVGRQTSYEHVLNTACQVLLIKKALRRRCRLWSFQENQFRSTRKLLKSKVIDYNSLNATSVILVEMQVRDGSWPLVSVDSSSNEETKLIQKNGLVGLKNVGNSCYINSAVQCLSHTRLLNEYFLNESYRRDINTTSKFGVQGRLAVVYGDLVRALWSSQDKPFVSPRNFKNVIAKLNTQFSGSGQHDAQELLAYLLSGLSEDLNRVVDKPYLEQPDSDGRCDTVVADEWWINHLRREVSVIVALFTGQFKSLLTCSTCGYNSARFEPFSYLQLPLPESSTRSIECTVVLKEDSVPIRCVVQVKRSGTIQDLLEKIVERYAEDGDKTLCSKDFCVTEVEDTHTIGSYYKRSQSLEVFRANEKKNIVIYQWDALPKENKGDDDKSFVTTKLCKGDLVGVRNDSDSKSIAARVTTANDDGTYNIVLADGKQHYERISRARLVARYASPVGIRVIHRRVERSTFLYFTQPFTTRLFGMPFVMRLYPGKTTGIDLYHSVRMRIKRFFRFRTRSFNTTESPTTKSPSKMDAKPSSILSIASGTDDIDGWGFCLRFVTELGTSCSRCHWLVGCRGCLVNPSNQLVDILSNETLSVDYDTTTLNEEYDSAAAAECIVCENNTSSSTSLSLSETLKLFTESEDLQAFCKDCKCLQPATKTMELWRLPPILVIHLKRFQFTSSTRRKLTQLVNYPLKGLDLSTFMASSGPKSNSTTTTTSSSTLESPGRSNFVYDLYAVVNHIGALGAGHYVACVLSACDGKWKCFNDQLCRDINEEDVLSSTAYILFYIRRDLKDAKINDIFPPNTGQPMTQEDIERLLNQRDTGRCNIM